MIASGDSNHVQPFALFLNVDGFLSLTGNIATQNFVFQLQEGLDLFTFWSKHTMTYQSDGTRSLVEYYVNATLVGTYSGGGGYLRWSDGSSIIFGGYALGATTMINKQRFLGWMDDLAFYNRVLDQAEIASNWMMLPNASDHSLFIYYDFEEGPGAAVFKNKGVAGAVADMYNGKVFGGKMYYEVTSQGVQPTQPATVVRERCKFPHFLLQRLFFH